MLPKSLLVASAAALGLTLAGPVDAWSQSRKQPPTEDGQTAPNKTPEKAPEATPKSDKGGKDGKNADIPDATAPEAGATAEAETSGPKRPKLIEKMPQTAEEKTKLLGNLYAHLAAAEDEASAKRATAAIERVWRHSGSPTIDLLLERAARAIGAKNPGLATKLLDRAVALAPDFPEAFNLRAFLRFTENNYEGAVGDLRRVLALEPNHYKALEALAQIWRESGNKKGALNVMKQLLDVHPFASGAKQTYEELKREVDGQGI